jgi:hypothetical protein
VLSLGAAIAEIVIGAVAATHPPLGPNAWEGPSLSTLILFTGIAILGGASLRQGWVLLVGTLFVLAATATMIVASFVQAELGQFSLMSTLVTAGILIAVCTSIVLIIRHQRRDNTQA